MSKVIRLTENQFGEMMAYHGSHTDFNRFNHKKYLDTGAGDHAFGWGTYITNDEAIARDYASKDLEVDFMNKFLSNCDQKKRGNFLYEVEIPDDNGQNYLEYNAYTSPDEKKRIYDTAKRIEQRFNFKFSDGFYSYLDNGNDGSVRIGLNNEGPTNSWIYYMLGKNLGSEKAASLFLNQCGYVGFKYRAGTRWNLPDGASNDAYNYVIFDASNVKIVNKTSI